MATKMTKSALKNDFSGYNIAFGYCELQTILNNNYWGNKIGYCTNIYGWACDFYYNLENTDVNIVTGYNTDRAGCYKLTDDELQAFRKLEKAFNSSRTFKKFDEHQKDLPRLKNRFKRLLLQVKTRILENR